MKAVLMRVQRASVTIDERETRSIGRGFLILLAVTHDDTEAQAVKLADKLGGEIMIVSQFTLYGNCRKGRRPEFLNAARPETAIPLYEKFVSLVRAKGYHVETGEFGAYMAVDSVNDGPFTLIVDTKDLEAPK